MNKNALMFNLHVEDKNSMHYYSMLYYALETLEKFYDETFDVIVHYKTKNFEFEKEFVGIKPEDLVTPANSNLEIGGRDNPYYCVNIIDNKIQITDVKTTIIHYSAAHASVMLPNRLFTDHLLNGYNEWVTKIPNIIKELKK